MVLPNHLSIVPHVGSSMKRDGLLLLCVGRNAQEAYLVLCTGLHQYTPSFG